MRWKWQITWPSVALVAAVLVAIVVLAVLGEYDTLRILVPILVALFAPAPLRLEAATSSSSSPDEPPPDTGEAP
jgi:uncharacterized membrane protein